MISHTKLMCQYVHLTRILLLRYCCLLYLAVPGTHVVYTCTTVHPSKHAGLIPQPPIRCWCRYLLISGILDSLYSGVVDSQPYAGWYILYYVRYMYSIRVRTRYNAAFIKSWKTSAVSTSVWMVETQLCELRGTFKDEFRRNARHFFFFFQISQMIGN